MFGNAAGRFLTVSSLLFAALAAGAAMAADRTWKPAGFGGAGSFLGVYFDPTQPGVVYAASDVAGVLRSTDYGDHWEFRSRGLGNYEIASFAIDPFDPRTLYAGVGAVVQSNRAGIYVSRDSGQSWQQLTSTAKNRISFRKFRTARAIAPDPTQRGVILSGSRENGIWRSADGGQTWTQVFAAPLTSVPLTGIETPLVGNLFEDDPTTTPYPAPVSVVEFDPADSSVVYAALDGAGVIRSTARGMAGTWQPLNSGLPADAKVRDIAVSSGGTLYAVVCRSGVYKFAGGTWTAVNNGLPLTDAWVSSVAAHPTNPNIAYVTVPSFNYTNVWKTTDGGATWIPKGDWSKGEVVPDPVNNPTRGGFSGPTMSFQVTLDRANPNRLFKVDYWSILRSDDGGDHWADKIVGAQNTCVSGLAVDTDHPAGQPDVVYATHWDAGLLASSDAGATWKALLPPPAGWNADLAGHYWRFAITRSAAGKYYYVTGDPGPDNGDGLVFRSTDGANWSIVFRSKRPAGTWLGGAMLGLAVDPNNPSTLYVDQDGGKIYKSTDNGTTWAATAGQPGGNSFTYALAVDAAGRVFAGTLHDGLWRSADGGSSWQRVMNEVNSVFHLAAAAGAIYASTGDDANLYRSADSGASWQRLTDFTADDDGDGGPEHGMAIAVDPRDPKHLIFGRMDTWYPGDAGAGVFESTDGGASWKPISDGLGVLNIAALAVASDGTLFAGTACGGIWKLAPSPAIPAFTSVSAASFSGTWLAAESIVSGFGQGLSPAVQTALSTPLPTSLAGTSVRVTDSSGVERLAALFFASPSQINYLVPAGTRTGQASVSVTVEGKVVAAGSVTIGSVAPALFAANENGRGVAAGLAVRVAGNGSQVSQLLFQPDRPAGSRASVPIDFGAATDQVVLTLFGTGIRGRSALSAAGVKVGGSDAEVVYAGAQGSFVGLDQVNVRLPRSLAGRGELDVALTVDGRSANAVTVNTGPPK